MNIQTPFEHRVAYGSAPGAQRVFINGYSGAVTTSHTVIWGESAVYTLLAANFSSPTISSNDANDAAAGTGARTVAISGLDSAYAAKSETLTLNGTTGVSLVNNYMIINSMEVITAGSGGKNAGAIFVGTGALTSGKPAVVHGRISAGLNIAKAAIYGVPTGYKLLVDLVSGASRNITAGGHEIQIETAVNGGLTKVVYLDTFQNVFQYNRKFDIPLAFAEKTLLKASMLASAGTGPASCILSGYLVSDEFAQAYGL